MQSQQRRTSLHSHRPSRTMSSFSLETPSAPSLSWTISTTSNTLATSTSESRSRKSRYSSTLAHRSCTSLQINAMAAQKACLNITHRNRPLSRNSTAQRSSFMALELLRAILLRTQYASLRTRFRALKMRNSLL